MMSETRTNANYSDWNLNETKNYVKNSNAKNSCSMSYDYLKNAKTTGCWNCANWTNDYYSNVNLTEKTNYCYENYYYGYWNYANYLNAMKNYDSNCCEMMNYDYYSNVRMNPQQRTRMLQCPKRYCGLHQ